MPALIQAFVLWRIIASNDGNGFGGMAIFFMSPFILIITTLLNLWTLALRKSTLRRVFACGAVAPTIVSFAVWLGFPFH